MTEICRWSLSPCRRLLLLLLIMMQMSAHLPGFLRLVIQSMMLIKGDLLPNGSVIAMTASRIQCMITEAGLHDFLTKGLPQYPETK